MAKTILATLASCQLIAGYGHAVDTAFRQRVALIVETTPSSTLDSLSDVEIHIGNAIAQYGSLWMSRHGCENCLATTTPPLSDQAIAALVVDSHLTVVVYVKPTAKLSSRYVRSITNHDSLLIDGWLNIDMAARVYSARHGTVHSTRDTTISTHSRESWLWHDDASLTPLQDSLVAVTPEPFEFVIQRAVSSLLGSVHIAEAKSASHKQGIAVTIVADSSFVRRHGTTWPGEIEGIVRTASRALSRQCDITLDLSDIITSYSTGEQAAPIKSNLDALKRISRLSDTLTILVTEKETALEYFTDPFSVELGVTDLRGSRIVIDCVPTPHPAQSDWFFGSNALIMLHEVGHAYGAIHVFDRHSVMSHRMGWIGSSTFDTLNAVIMRHILSGDINAADPVGYVGLVSRALQETRYQLADFPDFFWRMLSTASPDQLPRMMSAISYEPYILAAEAMRMLQSGDSYGAAALWKKALELEPRQPVLLYYLSLSTTGGESLTARREAITLGLYDPSGDDRRIRSQYPR